MSSKKMSVSTQFKDAAVTFGDRCQENYHQAGYQMTYGLPIKLSLLSMWLQALPCYISAILWIFALFSMFSKGVIVLFAAQ